MDWTWFTLVIPVARWTKKRLDLAAIEKRISQKEQAVSKKEAELDELVKLQEYNVEHLPDLILLQVESLHYQLGQIVEVAEIQFTVANRSIFDVTLHKFTANPHFQGYKLPKLQDIEERKVSKQSATSFTVIYDLPQPTVKLIGSLEQTKSKTIWGFEMHGYFRSEIKDFDKSQTDSIYV